MIYSLVRYYVDKGQKILLVVPTTSLVEQMYKDFLIMVGMLIHIVTVSIRVEKKLMNIQLQLQPGNLFIN
jgi:reverse gyrase